ncbi:MAG: ABC transporter permease [Spirochaetales bacterium]|nr:ABC transporter permease [Spirochaetales bacterium]
MGSRVSAFKRFLHFFLKNPLTLFGIVLVFLFLVIALAAPVLAPYPDQGRGESLMTARLQAPSAEHLLGTDALGRDILSRILFGSRVSLKAALTVILIVIAVGTPLGIIAGYVGGVVDDVIMRISDLFLAFPSLLLAVAIVAALGPNLTNAMIALSVPWWPWYTRITRSQTLSLKERQFVDAARSVGVPAPKIMFRHILPNCITPVIVQATLDMGYIILALAGLSFLGLGSQPPTADWGVMISEGRSFILTHWWISTFPGVAILFSVLGFNLVGDGIAEVMNPKRRR